MKDKKTNTKKEKKQKLFPAKKLPKLFKKKYSEKKLNNKIYKKIYIAPDLEFVKKIFVKEVSKKGKEYWTADKKLTFPKAEIKRYKKLAKQIKKNRGGFKLVPFIAVAVFLGGIIGGTILFKNTIAKIAIQKSLQSVFEAKTDVEKVNVGILDATITVEGLQQANAASPMKNVFQIDKLEMDFNLTDLLKGKLHSENMEVSGVAIDTPRKTSGSLSKKTAKEEKKSEAAAKKESKKQTESKNQNNKQEQKKTSKKSAGDELKNMFKDYNPENLLANVQNELKSPALAEKLSADVQQKIDKWGAVPGEYEKSVNSLKSEVESLVKTDWGRIYEIDKIKQTSESIVTAINQTNELIKKIDKTTADIKTDSALVQSYTNQIQAAVKSDTALVDVKIKEMKTMFSARGLQSVMTKAVSDLIDSVLGDYAPYGQKVLSMVQKSKASNEKASDKVKKQKKNSKTHGRSKGRDVYYKADTVPKLYLEKLVASGYEYNTNNLLFKGTAKDISNNQDMVNKPMVINADFKVAGAENSANVIVDGRQASASPLITADYKGKGYPVNADVEVFNVTSKSNIGAKVTAEENGTCTVKGSLEMIVSKMEGMDFEPAPVCKVYKNALSEVKKLNLNFEAKYNDGLSVNILNPEEVTKQLVNPVTTALTKELNSIGDEVRNQVANALSDKTGIATDKIKEFTDIEKVLKDYQKELNNLKSQLNNQQSSLKKKGEDMAKAAAKEAADKAAAEAKKAAEQAAAEAKKAADEAAKKAADEAAKKAADEAAKKLESAATDAAKNMLKGFF